MELLEATKRSSASSIWKMTLVFGIGLLIAVTSFGAGILAERDILDGGSSASNAEIKQFDQLFAVKDLIDGEYYAVPDDSGAATEFDQSLAYGAIQGMMGTLDDYSTFLVPAEQTAVREQLSGEYQGIGIWVGFPDGHLKIISPMPGSPAEE